MQILQKLPLPFTYFHITYIAWSLSEGWKLENLRIPTEYQEDSTGKTRRSIFFTEVNWWPCSNPTTLWCTTPVRSPFGYGVPCNWSNIWAFNLASPLKFRSEGFTCDMDWKQGGSRFHELKELKVAGVDSTDCESVQQFLFYPPVHPKHPSYHDTGCRMSFEKISCRWTMRLLSYCNTNAVIFGRFL